MPIIWSVIARLCRGMLDSFLNERREASLRRLRILLEVQYPLASIRQIYLERLLCSTTTPQKPLLHLYLTKIRGGPRTCTGEKVPSACETCDRELPLSYRYQHTMSSRPWRGMGIFDHKVGMHPECCVTHDLHQSASGVQLWMSFLQCSKDSRTLIS